VVQESAIVHSSSQYGGGDDDCEHLLFVFLWGELLLLGFVVLLRCDA